jgi:glycolate oxidase iron-sulfur subunit
VAPELARRPLRERAIPVEPPDEPEAKAAYFVGCAMNFVYPDAAERTIELLSEDCDVRVARNGCCGLPAFAYGDESSAKALARVNLERLSRLEADIIVTECASCASFLKDYPKLLGEDDPDHGAAAALADKVRDFTEILAARGSAEAAGDARTLRVTYHVPCHLGRYQELGDLPERILKSISGVEYVPMKEADWCCGGAGTYAFMHEGTSEAVLERKLANIEASGADAVATSCPACLMQLEYGLRSSGLKVRAVMLGDLVARDEGGHT